MAEPIFSFRRTCYSYPGALRLALADVTFDVRRGEWVALVGRNGSGKTTLAKIASALLSPTGGACFVRSLNISHAENQVAARQGVAIVFQNPDDQIVASIVEEDAAFGPENLALPAEEIKKRVDDALEAVGLAELRRRGTYSLSGGQKQRLALAGALALRPEALILDEATSMLDPEGRMEFADCLRSLSAGGMTILQITHRMEEAADADRIVVLESGRVAWDGGGEDFFDSEYLRLGFDEPQELALCRELRSRKLVPYNVKPQADALWDALGLCQ